MKNNQKTTQQELVDLLCVKTSASRQQAEDFLKSFFAVIEEQLLDGEMVKINNFGAFKLQWNEPRKSVNINTGEEFVIDGYYKIVFAPEQKLKDAVNEPFAHLEPIMLDEEEGEEKAKANTEAREGETAYNEEFSDNIPLRIFEEQANEIKDILSEINAIDAGEAEEQEVETKEEEDIKIQEVIENENVEEKIQQEEIENLENKVNEKDEDSKETDIETYPEFLARQYIEKKILQDETKDFTSRENAKNENTEMQKNAENENIENETQQEIESMENEVKAEEEEYITAEVENENADVIENEKKSNKKRVWLWWMLIIIAITGGLKITYFSSSCVECWVKYDLLNEKQRVRIIRMENKLNSWFSTASDNKTTEITQPTILPDSICVEVKQIDKMQNTDTLDKPRVYNEFIATETMNKGVFLTQLSLKYYGDKDFWVYIYEANSAKYKNPDLIPEGATIKIPKLDKRLIDSANPQAKAQAHELQNKYVKH
ncbi:MAG: HU family DNA-binding protein [Paludibacter sp.]|jgi:nucleoid DNA-binding protein|nr:HU family DNA-binding protein [Paludibacter sp.]